jgi:predicted transglutaminase-like protease
MPKKIFYFQKHKIDYWLLKVLNKKQNDFQKIVKVLVILNKENSLLLFPKFCKKTPQMILNGA